MGKRAFCKTRVIVKSSETVPRQPSRTCKLSNFSRLIAVDPPQQKFFLTAAPREEVIEAFHTDRRCEAKPPWIGMNQRYPVVAPSLWSASGATKDRSQLEAGRASESTNTSTSLAAEIAPMAARRLWTFCPVSQASPAITILTCIFLSTLRSTI